MVQAPLLECSFFIPVRRDADLSDGADHEPETWQWLYAELFERFGGFTRGPGEYHGFYIDPNTNEQVGDASLQIVVAVPEDRVDELRRLLVGFAVIFQQKCIYLSVAGRVEFIEFPP
jgi:hypothetical protein